MQWIVSRLAAGGALVSVAVLASACGGAPANGVASKSAAAILATARAAEAGAHSFRLTASAVKGSRTDSYVFESQAPSDAVEEVALGTGVRYTIIQVGAKAYFRGNVAYLHAIGASAAGERKLAGKWIMDSINQLNAPRLDVYSALSHLVNEVLTSKGQLTRGPTSTVDGQQVVAVVDRIGGGTLYVATSGTPYPVEVVGHTTSGVTETLSFGKWDQPVSIAPPASYVPGSKVTTAG